MPSGAVIETGILGGHEVELQDARKLANQTVSLSWKDRKGEIINDRLFIYEVKFVPLYGPCLITDLGEIAIERVLFAQRAEEAA